MSTQSAERALPPLPRLLRSVPTAGRCSASPFESCCFGWQPLQAPKKGPKDYDEDDQAFLAKKKVGGCCRGCWWRAGGWVLPLEVRGTED